MLEINGNKQLHAIMMKRRSTLKFYIYQVNSISWVLMTISKLKNVCIFYSLIYSAIAISTSNWFLIIEDIIQLRSWFFNVKFLLSWWKHLYGEIKQNNIEASEFMNGLLIERLIEPGRWLFWELNLMCISIFIFINLKLNK